MYRGRISVGRETPGGRNEDRGPKRCLGRSSRGVATGISRTDIACIVDPPPPLRFGWNGRLGGEGVSKVSIVSGSFNTYSLEQYPRQRPILYFIYLLVYFISREAISLSDSSVLRPGWTDPPTPTPPHRVSTRNEGVGGDGTDRNR